MTKHKALQLVLAVALAAASLVVPFLMATTHNKVGFLTVMLAFFSLGLALVVLGVILVARSRLARSLSPRRGTDHGPRAGSVTSSIGRGLALGWCRSCAPRESICVSALHFFPPQPS